VLIDRWKSCSLLVWISLVLVVNSWMGVGTCSQDPPFSVPDGFVVQRVADDSLAHDCFCMTLDSMGRPVLSGPGYLRTLLDDDGDGIYDASVPWTKEIQQGAQGIWAEGRWVHWVADGGLWRSEDTNGDSIGDTRPVRLLELPTGGEHDAHAIRRGPDGFWYMIAGNFAANLSKLANDPAAPVTRPRSGTLWRISPDFSKRSVWAHGMRNCYDFDFLPDGQIVTFDSDDEREATLPWYRPTRVMVLGPGSDAGWCGSAWKDDDYRVTMPQVLARLGRGSPTGVVVYDHHVFPQKYHDAIFVLDWTFGRVIAIYPSKNLPPEAQIPGAIPSEIFMEPSGTAGFAPTDACVAPDGSLLICVGGRGTTGAVYRVIYAPSETPPSSEDASSAMNCLATAIEQSLLTASDAVGLVAILDAPSPWMPWSESQWRSHLSRATRARLLGIANGSIPLDGTEHENAKRVARAAQILTRIGERVPAEAILQASGSQSSAHRAAAWWLASRQVATPADDAKLQRGLRFSSNNTPALGTHWETHLGSAEERLKWETLGLKRWTPTSPAGFEVGDSSAGNALRRTWLWANSHTLATAPGRRPPPPSYDTLVGKLLFGPPLSGPDTAILAALGQRLNNQREIPSARDLMEVLTVLQASLGDRRAKFPPQGDLPADANDGYRGLFTSKIMESDRNNWARWALYFAKSAQTQGWAQVHAEATRTMAMMEPSDPKCMDYLLDQIQADTHPTFDIHMLCCLAQCTAPRSPEATNKIASTLADMVRKVKARGLYTDNQWPTRLNQLVGALLRQDQSLGSSFVELPIPCCNEDLAVINAFPASVQAAAKQKMRSHLLSAPIEDWSLPILKYAVSENIDDALRDALRNALAIETLRPLCLELLSKNPREEDYHRFLIALESSERSEWPAAWQGLAPLRVGDAEREFPALAKLVSASLTNSAPIPMPPLLARTRAVAAQANKGAPPTSTTWSDWRAYLESNLTPEHFEQLVAPNPKVDMPTLLQSLDSLRGDPRRGLAIYQAKCGLCHGGQSALGPSLVGVTKRFARPDLATAIYDPSRDVPDRYRSVRVLTIDDEVLTGIVIYNAADGVTLQAADGSILRINQDNIQEKAYSTESLMPAGLLDDKSPQEVADLFAYLGTL
jgi:putative heme-binding domain-containing protein